MVYRTYIVVLRTNKGKIKIKVSGINATIKNTIETIENIKKCSQDKIVSIKLKK